jgi:hypothetical protein
VKWMSRSKLAGTLCWAFGALYLVAGASAGSHKDHPYSAAFSNLFVDLERAS